MITEYISFALLRTIKTYNKRAYLSKDELHCFIEKFLKIAKTVLNDKSLYIIRSNSYRQKLFSSSQRPRRFHWGCTYAANISRVSTISESRLKFSREKRPRSTNSAMWGSGSTAPKYAVAVYDEPFSGSFATGRITSFTTRNDGDRGRSKLPARSSVKIPLCDSARLRFTFEFNGNFISHLYFSSVFQHVL